MKTVSCFPSRARIAALAFLAAWFVGPGEGHAQFPGAQFPGEPTCQKVPPEGHVTSNPIACTVSCAKGGKVASALALAPRTTAGLTITIKGTCIEAVDNIPGNVTLQGASSGDGLQAPASSSNPVLGISGAGVTLDNLTISGGVNALLVHSGATAVGNNLVIEGSSIRNVLANGIVTLSSSTIEHSNGDGIDALSGGTVFLNGGTVGNNSRGVLVGGGSYLLATAGAVISDNTGSHGVDVSGGTLSVFAATIEGNSRDGIILFTGGNVYIASTGVVGSNGRDGVRVFGGVVHVQGGVISNNAEYGISVFNGGTAVLDTGAVVASNGANGVLVEDGTVNLGNGDGSATIQSNGANGIYLKTNSVGFFFNAGNKIVNNSGWGILCDGPPANPLIAIGTAGTIGTVSGNGAGQISCNIAP
jgi:hypothetical protein